MRVFSTSTSSRPTASQTVRRFYEAVNRRDYPSAISHIHPAVRYEDMVYQEPLLGRAAMDTFLKRITSLMPDDLVFVIDEMTSEESEYSVGMTWHVELRGGVPFPFGRGCSFYRIDPTTRQILYARDIVEPASKPGAAAIQVLRAVTPLVRATASWPAGRMASLPVWLAYGAYWWFVMLSPQAPGAPVYATSPETLHEVLGMSINFFYVNPLLFHQVLGVTLVPDVSAHPADEALFNAANAWSAMFLPLMLFDNEASKEKLPDKTRWSLWTGTMFLTNVFFLPYLALRASAVAETTLTPSTASTPPPPPSSASDSMIPQVCGAIGLTIFALSAGWLAYGRPELAPAGDLTARLTHLADRITTDRVSYAFAVDSVLYSIWQAWLLGKQGAPAILRFTPFVGQAIWLLQGMKRAEPSSNETPM